MSMSSGGKFQHFCHSHEAKLDFVGGSCGGKDRSGKRLDGVIGIYNAEAETYRTSDGPADKHNKHVLPFYAEGDEGL